jgi:hypothetical protein
LGDLGKSMRRFIAGLLVFAAASVVGCGSDDDEAETCCRIRRICGTCECPTSWKAVADAGDDDSCTNYLESNRDVANGCSVYSAEDAKRLCT